MLIKEDPEQLIIKYIHTLTRTIWVSCLSHFLPGDVYASRAKTASVLDTWPPLSSFDLLYP